MYGPGERVPGRPALTLPWTAAVTASDDRSDVTVSVPPGPRLRANLPASPRHKRLVQPQPLRSPWSYLGNG